MNVALDRIRRSPSPRIARQLAAAGLSPFELRHEHLSRLPAIRPQDLDLTGLDDPVGAALLADAARPVRLGTSARGDATIVLPFTAADLLRAASYGARALTAAGVRPRTIVANTLDGGLETPGSLGLGDALERLGALDVPLGPVADAKAASAIAAMVERVGAEILVLDSASAVSLRPALGALDSRSWRGTIELGVGAVGSDVGDRWSRRWLSIPEISVFLAVECDAASLHLDPDVEAEVRDGTLRLSALAGDTPLLAYEPGVTARAIQSGCRCGDDRRFLVI